MKIFLTILTFLLASSADCQNNEVTNTLLTGYSHSVVYFAKSGKIILINGGKEAATTGTKTELWEFSNHTWNLINATGPQARNWFAAAYDQKEDISIPMVG
jgi:hypothetical protein